MFNKVFHNFKLKGRRHEHKLIDQILILVVIATARTLQKFLIINSNCQILMIWLNTRQPCNVSNCREYKAPATKLFKRDTSLSPKPLEGYALGTNQLLSRNKSNSVLSYLIQYFTIHKEYATSLELLTFSHHPSDKRIKLSRKSVFLIDFYLH